MMNYQFPETIENIISERTTFNETVCETDGNKVIIKPLLNPGGGCHAHSF